MISGCKSRHYGMGGTRPFRPPTAKLAVRPRFSQPTLELSRPPAVTISETGEAALQGIEANLTVAPAARPLRVRIIQKIPTGLVVFGLALSPLYLIPLYYGKLAMSASAFLLSGATLFLGMLLSSMKKDI